MTDSPVRAVARWHLAQVNIARARTPLTDSVMADFIAHLDAVNAAAEASRGFIWRLKAEDGGSSAYVPFSDDPRVIVNMSVWTSIEPLETYVYRINDHADVFRDRRRWFEPMEGPQLALWWIGAGQIPTVDAGRQRLEFLRRNGPTPYAFTFKRPFPPPAFEQPRAG